MITIIGDTPDELADVQAMIETAVLNNSKPYEIDVTYKLSSGNLLLVNNYNRIVGEQDYTNEVING